jgi:hypothetical protein
MEAGSAAFRSRLDEVWGGLAGLGRHQLSLISNEVCACDAFPVTFAALRDHVDATRPIRQLVRRDDPGSLRWAIAFAPNEKAIDPTGRAAPRPAGTAVGVPTPRDRASPIDTLPAICQQDVRAELRVAETPPPGELCAPCATVDRPGDRAIVCGTGDAADALRADFVARGWSAPGDVLHLEQHDRWWKTASRVVLDVRESAGALHATMRATPRTPPTGSVSKAALAAASRVHAWSTQVHVGQPNTAYGLEVPTPLGFDGFDVAIPTRTGPSNARISDRSLIFVEMPVAKLAPQLVAYWRKAQGKDTTVHVEPMRAPPGVPAGTRGLRVQERWRSDGKILACPPGGCKVVGHEPPETFRSGGEYLLIPVDGGTWIAQTGDAESVKAVMGVITSTTTPPTWTLPALALGKQSTARAEWFWVERLLDDGDLQVEIDGSIKP